MKLNKKKVFVAALAICVVAILSFGTLAWFTAEDTVENSFKVTTSDDVGTPDFSLVLFEHKVDPETGKIASTDEVKSNEYKNIVPGITVDKNPTVRNTGAYDQWIRMSVTITDYDVFCAALTPGGQFDFSTMLNIDSTVWAHDAAKDRAIAADGKTATFTYYLNEKLLAKRNNGDVFDTATLFTTVTVPFQFTEDNMKFTDASGEFKLTVFAEAVQADVIADNSRGAFERLAAGN